MDIGFLLRQTKRKAKREAVQQETKHRRMQRVDYLCKKYEDAYYTWAGEHIKVRYMNGRYYPGKGKLPLREDVLIHCTNKILAQIHAEELPAVEES